MTFSTFCISYKFFRLKIFSIQFPLFANKSVPREISMPEAESLTSIELPRNCITNFHINFL